MTRTYKTPLGLVLLSSICLTAGTLLAVNETSVDPMSKTPVFLVVGAFLIAVGLVSLYFGVAMYLRHRDLLEHKRGEGSYIRQRSKRKRTT
jgi:drug/metabolite transporter (DMT)-like permease